MNTVNENALKYMKSELKKARVELLVNESGRKGIDFIINTKKGNSYEILFKCIVAVTEQSIKIPKQYLGELKENMLIGLVLLIESEAKVLYLIPSIVFLKPNLIFKSNDVMLPHLSNWEIRVFTNAIPELSKYALENIIDKL